ncbi:hypothetical protein CBR_g53784 [Chara braunii]|uniref:Molybdopterin biosynthesis protein CNX1 n=1 Tax=Chara braunii TaxID=69332 RepID=A0A388K792_CHABU|nr:hypothetical protein CBR_g53784 [Chara braunii]|eukprot:GBG65813.1 hypothetical protein CBR_g53784 [Chara braunii]
MPGTRIRLSTDGYAVVAADGPGVYPVIGEVRAGADPSNVKVIPGHVVYITTGGPVPEGADAVVQVENTLPVSSVGNGEHCVQIVVGAQKGQDIRPVGCDIMEGEVILKAGERIGYGEVGLLASVDRTRVKVYEQPVVAVLSTGDEIVDAAGGAAKLGPGYVMFHGFNPSLSPPFHALACASPHALWLALMFSLFISNSAVLLVHSR